MMNLIFDSHAHYDDSAFDADRDELLAGLKEKGIGLVVNACAAISDLKDIIPLTRKYDFLYGASGVHPSELSEMDDKKFADIEMALDEPKIVAVGEIGLDYHYDDTDKPLQKEWFARQIDLAKRKNYPIIVHSRDAAADTLDIIKAENAREAGGVIHCFSYEKEMAKIYMDMGFYIGVGGVVTYKNGRKLKEVVEYMPLEKMLLETDCPYLSPEPFRGRRNDSSMLNYVADKVAEIKGTDRETVIEVTRENAKRMYRIN